MRLAQRRPRTVPRATRIAPAGACWLLAALLAAGGCEPPESRASAAARDSAPETYGFTTVERGEPGAGVRLGVQVLLRDRRAVLQGRRVGLITNHTGISPYTGGGPADPGGEAGEAAPVSTIDLFHEAPDIRLVALFSPEHGIRGRAGAGEAVASGTDPATGLPIHSLYGEQRKPTPEMLEGIDVLVFDIQDIGSRYYTYIWTMALAMEAAAEAGLPFVVLDRPNPIGGRLVQGNVLDAEHATFVGLYPIAMRHGMTVGEIARYLNAEFAIGAGLVLVPMQGWSRDMWFDETALPWIAPSPNMPSLESATHYPGSCLFEGTNLSVGRGTPRAFQQIGAPWLDHRRIADRLNARALPGVRFEAVTFTPRSPGDRKFDGASVRGIRFVTTDRDAYDPTHAAVAALAEIRATHPDRLAWRTAHFDRLAGTERLRQRLQAGESVDAITDAWAAERGRFRDRRRQYLLYR